jgi:chromosome segregation ATPase
VDQIYEVIRQGSRTTINDELKRWKAERAQADALADTLPPAIAESMRTLWAAAADQARQQFATERAALIDASEAALASCRERNERLAQMQAQRDSLAEQVATLTAALEAARQVHATIDAARAAATAEAATLRETLDQERSDSARERTEARASLEAAQATHQAALAEQAQAFRDELNRATERLQQSEAQMLKQIDDSRVMQRRAEAHLAKVQEQNASLRTELAELRQRAHRDQQELAAAQHTLTTLQSRLTEVEALAADRERALITQTAHAEAAQRVIGTLEAALQRPRRARPQPPAT